MILSLDFGVGVPRCFCGAEKAVVCGHAAVITPVVDEIDDEFDAVGLSARDDVVEALETVGARVYLWCFARDETLVPDS